MSEPKIKKIKIPKKLATRADRLYLVRQDRYAAQKAVDSLKAEETALIDSIIDDLPKSEALGISGKVARVTLTKKDFAQVEDWEAVQKYIVKNKAWDLMQKRISDGGIKARWEDGKKVPGVKKFIKVGVSINKV
jgi:hypothetical protein